MERASQPRTRQLANDWTRGTVTPLYARRGLGGTPCSGCGALLSLFRSHLLPGSPDGSSLIQTGVVGRDGAVGALLALDARVSPNKIVVQMPSTAAVFEADQFAKIAQIAPCVRSLVLSHAEFFLAEVQQSAACNAVHSVQQRMYRWLLCMNVGAAVRGAHACGGRGAKALSKRALLDITVPGSTC
jgi:hypothetical protein